MRPRLVSCPENDTHIGGTHESPGERRDGGAGISVPGDMEAGVGICVRGRGEDVDDGAGDIHANRLTNVLFDRARSNNMTETDTCGYGSVSQHDNYGVESNETD